jgi:hypothetical protein
MLRPEAVPRILRLQAVLTTGIIALGVLGLSDESILPSQPALISTRVYRAAWSPTQALRTLEAEEGTAFDGRCVAALERLVTGAHPLRAHAPIATRERSQLAHGRP